MRPTGLCVIGLGAIGGSVARRAAAEGTERIVGYSRSQPDAKAAAEAGAVHEVAHSVEAAVIHFWKHLMGADPVPLEANRHNALVAWTSHLPQAVASATARLAGSSAELWTDILIQNRDAILPTLQAMQEAQAQLRAALARRDADGVRRWLERGAAWRRGVDT